MRKLGNPGDRVLAFFLCGFEALSITVQGWRQLLVALMVAGAVHLTHSDVNAAGNLYYVAPNGSDDSFGDSEQPWRTIQKAADTLLPGDKVIVKAGTYHERVQINVNGLPGEPVIFEGERGPNGEWLTIIDGGDPVRGWLPAPEVGPGVYKTNSIPYEPYAMTVDNTTVWRINTASMNGVLVESAGGTGFDALARPAAAVVQYPGFPEIKFWDGIEALFGYRDGITYLRFRNGDDPNQKNVRSSPGPVQENSAPDGAGVLIGDKSFIVLKGFWIRAARSAVLVSGRAATDNIIEENLLTNGNTRIYLYGGASRNHVRNNEMKMNVSSTYRPGLWDNSYGGAIRYHIYFQNKFLVGRTAEDDHNVRVWDRATNNLIYSNHIYDAITGISLWHGTSETKIAYNEIHNHSAQGFELFPEASAEIYGNLIYENRYGMRLHSIQTGDRLLYIYRNRFYNAPDSGEHVYFEASWDVAANSNAEVYFYHNSLAGARNAFLFVGFAPGYGMRYTYFLNNILSSRYIYNSETTLVEEWHVGLFDYNWFGGEFVGDRGWHGRNNVLAWNQKLWNDESMPDFSVPAGSSSRNAGIDLSRPFTIGGRTYPALPGMTPGYFAGPRPDLGAIQSFP